jgi:hypothetical protein
MAVSNVREDKMLRMNTDIQRSLVQTRRADVTTAAFQGIKHQFV